MGVADVGGDANKLSGEEEFRGLDRLFGCLGMGMASDERPGRRLHGKCDLCRFEQQVLRLPFWSLCGASYKSLCFEGTADCVNYSL